MTWEQIAGMFCKSQLWCAQHEKILNLCAEVLELMDPDLPKKERLRFSSAFPITDVKNPRIQLQMARIILLHNLGKHAAIDYVRTEAEKLGEKVGDPNRTPRDDYRILLSFTQRTEKVTIRLAEKPQSKFDQMFRNRSDVDGIDIEQNILKIIANLESLKVKIRQALANKKTATETGYPSCALTHSFFIAQAFS